MVTCHQTCADGTRLLQSMFKFGLESWRISNLPTYSGKVESPIRAHKENSCFPTSFFCINRSAKRKKIVVVTELNNGGTLVRIVSTMDTHHKQGSKAAKAHHCQIYFQMKALAFLVVSYSYLFTKFKFQQLKLLPKTHTVYTNEEDFSRSSTF